MSSPMSFRPVLTFTLFASIFALLAGCSPDSGTASAMVMGNPITGAGLPNPVPVTTPNWGKLPEGRKWGTSAGIEIDPIDGNIWAYERCGGGALQDEQTNCDTNPVDPIFKFDRNTGAVLANFGKGIMVTPHGISVDREGNVWVTDFAGNPAGTKGHQVHKFSPKGELLMSLGTAGKPGSGPNQFNQPNDVIVADDGSIFVSDGHSGQGMLTDEAMQKGRESGATASIIHLVPDGKTTKGWGR